MDMIDDGTTPLDPSMAPTIVARPEPAPQDPKVELHVTKIIKRIKGDRQYHSEAFKRMERDMFVATHGREKEWYDGNYTTNIIGRFVKQKTAALYAKNPKATAKRKESLDFRIWDEEVESLKMAAQTVMMAQQAAAMAAAQPPVVDPVSGMETVAEPQMPPGFEMAQAILEDAQQGMERRKQIDKIGKTLEILFAQALHEQKPVDFKTAAKQVVRRACTTGVGYVEIGFQREVGPRPGMTEKLADARTRIDHLRRLTEEASYGEITDADAEMAELEASLAALNAEPEVVLREGLIFDFPRSTKVIPDKLCKTLVGFIGARHLTIEYDFTVEEVKELFDVDLDNKFKAYSPDGKAIDEGPNENLRVQEEDDYSQSSAGRDGLVRVWKHYDKPSGLVYYVADGFDRWLREPAAPDVFVEDFWPVYALTFNEVENSQELFPPSDVTLLLDQQREYNRARQGKREHRQAARPRWVAAKGAFEQEDVDLLKNAPVFSLTLLNSLGPDMDLKKIIQDMPVPGVDPNLYDVNEIVSDLQMAGGFQEAQVGGTSKSSATEAAIAQGSASSADASSIDDLDAWLTVIARSSGQILLKEMSEEKVMEMVGPGAVWPQMTLADIAGEIFLEVEAGSTGKPNQAVEMANWEKMLPFLIQMPGIQPQWLAKETLRRLDDRMDLTSALASGLASIVAQNANAQPATADPGADPTAQGGEGANNGPAAPGGPTGSGPAFGSNQV